MEFLKEEFINQSISITYCKQKHDLSLTLIHTHISYTYSTHSLDTGISVEKLDHMVLIKKKKKSNLLICNDLKLKLN